MAGTIVAVQPEAAEAGALVLGQGGNAVDAAVACALVQGVVDPQMVGIAGFGTVQIYMPSKGVHECIDFHGTCPGRSTPEMWEHLLEGETRDGFGFLLKGKINDAGYASVAVPGSLRAYEELAGYGRFTWKDLLAPAIRQAREGFVVRPNVRAMWLMKESQFGRVDMVDKLKLSATGRAAYFRADGGLKEVGERVSNPDLAATLAEIAEKGADVFYRGWIAERIAEDMAAHGGLLTYDDLAGYRTRRSRPLRSSYRGLDIASSAPPAGGVMLIEMLNFLEHFEVPAQRHNSVEHLQRLTEAMKFATRDKELHVGDPAFVDIPLERLLSKAHAASAAKAYDRGERISIERLGTPESTNTTQLCVADDEGNIVTMTHSLGTASGIITDGLGFMYNACMNVFDPRPGRPGSIAPGKSRFTAMAPTIVFEDKEPKIVIGAPGGAHIAGALFQALVNIIDYGMSAVEAVSAPRISVTSNIVDVCNRIPRFVTDRLAEAGHPIARSPQSFAFGAPHALLRRGGGWTGGADPQRDGVCITI